MSDDDKPNNNTNPLRTGIKAFVNSTNSVLASLERTSQTVGKPLVDNIHVIGQESAKIGGQLVHAYEVRKQYGPEIIGTTAFCMTSLVGLRRGKLPGVVAGTMTAGLTYLGIYEVDLYQLKEKILKGIPPTK
mmetsp:Transcript_17218/g.24237  ORF Transcript_17218/g.24237 Transcript_17218/m.24237 type:complete len:132 (+) Transcript_17218:116-511(+)